MGIRKKGMQNQKYDEIFVESSIIDTIFTKK